MVNPLFLFYHLWETKCQNQRITPTLKFPTLNLDYLDRDRYTYASLILRVNFKSCISIESFGTSPNLEVLNSKPSGGGSDSYT